ncbi:phosphatidylinositol-4- kinase [Ascosphaera acerosa]|nr:phosphatidylinositol-4- kinase [Ascosphaera acerosa]
MLPTRSQGLRRPVSPHTPWSYLPYLHTIHVRPSPCLRQITPSPLDALARAVLRALLTLAARFTAVRPLVKKACVALLENLASTVLAVSDLVSRGADGSLDDGPEVLLLVAAVTVTATALLEVAASFCHVWTPEERIATLERARGMLSEQFLSVVDVAIDQYCSMSYTAHALLDWERYIGNFEAQRTPLSSILLRRGMVIFVEKATSLAQPTSYDVSRSSVLDSYVDSLPALTSCAKLSGPLAEVSASFIAEQWAITNDQLCPSESISASQARLARSLRASALVGFLNCLVTDDQCASAEVLFSWLNECLTGLEAPDSDDLVPTALKCMVVLAEASPPSASNINQSILRFLLQNGELGSTASTAAQCLARLLRSSNQDMIIGTIYSMGNFLSSTGAHTDMSDPSRTEAIASILYPDEASDAQGHAVAEDASSLTLDDDAAVFSIYRNVVHAIVTVASSMHDSKVVALAQSVLSQKIGKTNRLVDACIMIESAPLALHDDPAEFDILLKLYGRMYRSALRVNDKLVLNAILRAKCYLSEHITPTSPLYRPYLLSLLESVVNKGEIGNGEKGSAPTSLTAEELVPLLMPLAVLCSRNATLHQPLDDNEQVAQLFREVWFNLAVHGVSFSSDIAKIYHKELCSLAVCSPPLIAENRYELQESDLELNAVLRRGMNVPNSLEIRRRTLAAALPALESDIRRSSYPKVTFINAALLLECLRASSGDCAKVHVYFMDPASSAPEMVGCMKALADQAIKIYLDECLRSTSVGLTASHIAGTLSEIFSYCCHRVDVVRQVSAASANRIIEACPSSLCHKRAVFTLLDLLSVMWLSCAEEELDEYEWRPVMHAARSSIEVELPDDYELRRRTLSHLLELAFEWIYGVMQVAPLAVRSLLQTYLAESEDDGLGDQALLGRSVALELGSSAPPGERRHAYLQNINLCRTTLASEFVAQYTARQRYRCLTETVEALRRANRPAAPEPEHDKVTNIAASNDALCQIRDEIIQRKAVPFETVSSELKAAASLVCACSATAAPLLSHIVQIPFLLLTTQAIDLGLSLWVSIIAESPASSTKVIAEVAEAWEQSVQRNRGFFDLDFHHTDPFFLKNEFAPSNKEDLRRQQSKARSLIDPHSRVLQFLQSQFNATRLSNPHTQRLSVRIARCTMTAIRYIGGHPLFRQMFFDAVLFALDILRHSPPGSKIVQCRLKDLTLTAALSWFQHPCWWSYGGNRIQIKTEEATLAAIDERLLELSWDDTFGAGAAQSMTAKKSLLRILVAHERSRLQVWLTPLQQDRKAVPASTLAGFKTPVETAASLVTLAWSHHPNLAVQLSIRFPSPKIKGEVRALMLEHPEQAIGSADNLEVLLGPVLPPDVSRCLKYLLYWEPANPASAMTYFMPAYNNQPFIIQYAMRALDSHSVDVSFFYVPQLVQTLRYDALGYVERYIFQTAQLSQLFAHQVIWNMKANSYKDDDAQVPDAIKPALDKFQDSLEKHLSKEDREFYQREFAFFNEVTDISGKLKPYIKRTKAEKKVKIEEELKKIKVEVGVYLPSNPDGVVIGIDRKSGKPLQSHAKAPYMATFRIRKFKDEYQDGRKGMPEPADLAGIDPKEGKTVDVWQSAIFKVGDDCRQDLLALQMIATFRSIFASIGLDVFVYPYRVTATAPGCGVIDVLPKSISRDMLGRETVNGLYDYFVSKYGGAQSTRFQEARSNLVKSMAAYSVISYLLQFKDRHNGNIMIDEDGHIIHIDFGFCFDIAPGGVKFERAPFKLTSEMVAVMGGLPPSSIAGATPGGTLGLTTTHDPTSSQAYRWFESLVVKAFLASRPYAIKLSHLVALMLDSGLPCFKPETLRNFRDRFAPDKNEREAAEFMQELVRKSYLSRSTKEYDRFQLWTNKIPY